MKDLEIFKLEDRVLFEAAAVAEIVDAAAAAQDHAGDQAADPEEENRTELAEIQNVTPENPAASAQEQGKTEVRPEDVADVDALLDQLIEGDVPSVDADDMDTAETLVETENSDTAENMVEGNSVDNELTLSTEKELVVINGTVADKDVILSELRPDQDVLILENGNGLSELNEYLDSQDTKYSAIHFITHGNDGYISLNGELVKNGNFDPAEWSELGEHLTEDGDILFYGCDTAANEDGQLLLDKIAEVSGADVAASTDTTGVSGNWDLEYTIGNVDAEEIVVENFEHNLINYSVSNLTNDGADSLRQAVRDANDSMGTDEITFDVDGTIEFGSEIVIEDDITITGNGTDKTIFDGQGFTRFFTINAGAEVEISGITFQNGYAGDNGGAIVNSGTLTVTDSNFTENTASSSGGAIYSLNGTTTVSNSTFANNSANNSGGAILSTKTDGDSAELTVLNSTFANNSATSGKAVYNAGNLTIVNSILVGNGASKAEEIGGTGTIVKDINNLYSGTVTVENTYAEVDTNGKAVLDSDGTFHTKFGGSAHEKGVYIWHNDDYSAIAYSETAEGTKTAVAGDAALATTMISTDQKGESRTPTTEIGSYTIKKYFVDTYDKLKDAVEEVAANGGDNMIVVTDNITMEEGIFVDIENDLNLTIKGMVDTIELSGTGDIIMFEFMDNTYDYDIQITIDDLNFDGNGSADTAVSAVGVEVLTVKDSKVANFSDFSAIVQNGAGEGETLVIENTEFLNNVNTQQTSPSGGAVFASYVSVTISGSYFCNNSSMHNGGALEIQNAPTITIKDTTFESNSAVFDGGAANIVLSDNGKLVIDNSTFYQNSTKDSGNGEEGGNGGALFIDHTGDASKVTVTNSTFAANTAEGIGSAIYNSDGDAAIVNTLLIGKEGDTSVLAHEQGGEVDLSYSLVTSKDDSSAATSITAGTNAEIDASYHMGTVFGNYDSETHTIAPDAFHKAAWNGTKTGTGLDQLGNSREGINDTLENLKRDDSTTQYYTMGAVSAAAGLIVTQGDYETYYTGSAINPEEKLTLSFASGEVLKENIVSTELSSNPDPVLNPGKYTITPSVDPADITVTGLDADANVVFSSVAGTLTVNLAIQGTKIESVYGSAPDLKSTYSVTVQDRITGEDIDLTFNVEWQIDDTVITAGDYSATNHINASFYDDSLTVKDFTVTDQNGIDRKSDFTWDTSAKSDLDIDPAKLTVTIDGTKFNKVYDGTTSTETDDNNHSVTGIVSGDDVSASGSFAYDNKNAGTNKTVTMSGITLSGEEAGNYELVSDTVSSNGAEITPRQLELDVVIPTDKIYDGTTDVDSEATANNVPEGDDLVLDLQWNYNSADVNGATTITNTSWQLSGEDAGNYILPSVDPYNNISASITGKETETFFQTSAPYYYDGTDQSGTVSAFYIDINGNKVPLEINWDGQQFTEPGTYTVTVNSSDPNYILSGNVIQLTMNEAASPESPVPPLPPPFRRPAVHVYSAGLYNGFFSTVPGMQAILASSPSGTAVDNIYAMTYPELVNKSMLSYLNNEDEIFLSGLPEEKVSIDTLKYHPFTIDEPVREISENLTGNSNITHASALYSGKELFADNGDGEGEEELLHLFRQRSETLSFKREPLYMEEGFFAPEKLSEEYVFVSEAENAPYPELSGDNSFDEQIRNIPETIGQHRGKVDNMKSSLEKLLDEFCMA